MGEENKKECEACGSTENLKFDMLAYMSKTKEICFCSKSCMKRYWGGSKVKKIKEGKRA